IADGVCHHLCPLSAARIEDNAPPQHPKCGLLGSSQDISSPSSSHCNAASQYADIREGSFAVGCGHVSGLLVQPFSRPRALMWFARWVLIKSMGSTPVTQRRFSLLDARPISIMPSAPSATRDASRRVLSLWRCNGAPQLAAITRSPSLLSGGRARLRLILGGAMAGLVDAAVDHDGPGDARHLVGDRDRRLLLRHAAQQLPGPGI